ncbi:MAG: hypothetical protein JNK04_01835 [Myxococcales bacterium]|nr:hypothetical protein [Myxococcales bacterium]
MRALVLLLCAVAAAPAFAAPETGGSAEPHTAPVVPGPTHIAGPDAVAEVKAEIIVLHATNDGKGIDPAIGKIPELNEPPFSSYNSYKLLKRHEGVKLPKGEAKDLALPDKGKLSLTFKDTAKGKKDGDPLRYLLNASIKKPDGNDFLPGMGVSALKGKYFFIAGQKFEKGVLVVGIKITS